MQKYVASLQATNTVIQAVPPVIFTLLAGPWSDRNGRKFLIIFSMFGYLISNGVFIVNLYFFDELKAEYLLFESLQDLTGGRPVFCLASYAYITDVSDPKMRTKRLAYLDGVFPLGFYIGNALAGVIKKELGFYYNFGFGILSATIAILYCIFFVKDSRIIRKERIQLQKNEERENSLSFEQESVEIEDAMTKNKNNSCREMFQLNNLRELVTSITKKRSHHKRTIIILLILAFELEIFWLQGVWSSQFLYLRKVLSWTSLEYTRYTSILGV